MNGECHARAIAERQASLPRRHPQEAGRHRERGVEGANLQAEGEERGPGFFFARTRIDESDQCPLAAAPRQSCQRAQVVRMGMNQG